MVNWSKDDLNEYQAKLTKGRKATPREPRTCGREGCDVTFMPTGPRGKYCPKCTPLVKAEQNKSYKEPGYTSLEAQRQAYREKAGLPSVKDAEFINDPFKGEFNKCPDCGAVYDGTETCSGDKNRRQFTRPLKGIDFDYFVCFCGHTLERYK